MSRETAGAGLSPPRMISEEMLDDSGAGSRIDFERGMRYSAPATLALIAACFAVFLWQCGAGVLDNDAALVEGGALVRDRLLLGEVWRLASSMFLHGGFAHLVGNMIPLFILGMACEHAFGPVRMVAIYLAAGLAGGIATAVVEPLPTIGASGAVFGLMGCLVAVLQQLRRRVRFRDRRVAAVVAAWALWQIMLGFTEPMIATFAHIGGFFAGLVLGFVVRSRLATPVPAPVVVSMPARL